MMNKHVILISVDAMVAEDVPLLLAMPRSRALFGRRLFVRRMETVYPSLTHPVHAAVLAARPCGETGIINNTHPDSSAWYNDLHELRCDTLLHAVHRAGLTVAVSRWPVTARGNACIDWLIPEILDDDLSGRTMTQALADGGAGPVMDSVVRSNLHLLAQGNIRPGYDAFSAACAADMLRLYKPHLLLTHWGMVDTARHAHGLFGPHIAQALAYIDRWLGDLVDASAEAGILDTTDFILMSDHGQLNIDRALRLNALFAEKGLPAFARSAGLSAQVCVTDPAREADVHTALTALKGFDVLTVQEARARYGLFGDFTFVVDTDGRTAFENDCCLPLFVPSGSKKAAHGHLPHKGPQPPLLATSPSFARRDIDSGHVLDIAPTLAAILKTPFHGVPRMDWLHHESEG